MLSEFWKGHQKKEEAPAESHADGEHAPEDGKRAYRERKEALARAAREAPIPMEHRLDAVLLIRAMVREASDMKRLARAAEDRGERMRHTQRYQKWKSRIETLREDSKAADIELAWRQFVEFKARFAQFRKLTERARALKLAIRQQEIAIGQTASDVGVGVKGAAETRRLAAVARTAERGTMPEGMEVDAETVRELFGDEAMEIAEEAEDGGGGVASADGEHQETEKSTAELSKELADVQEQRQKRWDDPMVRWLWYEGKRKELRTQLQEGREVVNLPSTERLLSKMARQEEEKPTAIFGSVLLGPPGTGKTTAVREHCRRTGRDLVEIDLSGDITRYLFWGSKELVHSDPIARYHQLKEGLGDLKGEQLVGVLRKGIEKFGPSFLSLTEDAVDELGTVDSEVAEQYKQELHKVLDEQFQDVFATEVYKFGRENGWVAGMVMSALQKRKSILFNEFNKAKDLSFLNNVLTAKAATSEDAGINPKQERPGWLHVGDAKQWVRLPTMTAQDGTERAASKMFFTANIGKQYKVSTVLGPFISRSEGRTVWVDYVPKEEEIALTAALVEDGAGRPMIDNEMSNKFVWLIGEVIPKIRAFIEDKPQSNPPSFRTIRNLVEKLIDPRIEKKREGASIDRAAVEVLLEPYDYFPDKTIPAQIARELITQHIVTDRKIISELVQRGILEVSEVEALLGEGEVFAESHTKDTLHSFLAQRRDSGDVGEMPEVA